MLCTPGQRLCLPAEHRPLTHMGHPTNNPLENNTTFLTCSLIEIIISDQKRELWEVSCFFVNEQQTALFVQTGLMQQILTFPLWRKEAGLQPGFPYCGGCYLINNIYVNVDAHAVLTFFFFNLIFLKVVSIFKSFQMGEAIPQMSFDNFYSSGSSLKHLDNPKSLPLRLIGGKTTHLHDSYSNVLLICSAAVNWFWNPLVQIMNYTDKTTCNYYFPH